MMPSLNSNDEQKLVDGVRQAVRYVDDDNMSPNDALVKVSRDLSLLPGQARAAVSAFNNGRQVAQWKANTPVLDKLAEFELADYDVIHDTVWGGDEKKANDHYLSLGTTVHEDYASEPKWVDMRDKQKLAALDIPSLDHIHANDDIVKEASDHEFRHDSDRRASSAWSTFSMTRRTYEDQRSKHAAAKDNLGIRLNILSNYFKKFAQDRLPFDIVDKTVATYYGSQGRALMNVVSDRFPKEKRAADAKRYWEAPIDMNAEPFTFVRNAVEAAKELNLTKSALDVSEEVFNNAKEALHPFSQAPSQSSQENVEFSPFLIDGKEGGDQPAGQLPRHDCHGVHPDQTHEEWVREEFDNPPTRDWEREKEAAGGLLTGALIGGGAKPAMEALIGGEGRQRSVQDTEDKLGAPEHENELRKIRAQVMLAEMMSDSENPISGHDPEEVLAAYNDLAQLAPRIAEQPAAVQPLLAKRLAGNVEPFEVKEIGDIEKTLAGTKSNIMKSDDSIL
tara:strand:+ start:16882 stop:18396 length:1515 start_codon:yes stop_codon:yes gene_type:complete